MKYLKVFILVLIITGLTTSVFAETEERSAKIMEINGYAVVKLANAEVIVPAQVGMILGKGDILKTDLDSTAILNLNGNGETAIVEVKEGSEVLLAELIKDSAKNTEETLLDLAVGKILIKAQKLHTEESKFEVKTPTSVVGVRGTVFSVEVEALE